ncbi:hypothetical protein HMPREF1532_02594 [Bacteroides salyersiae WAL 10018 = DSM 18765 = JCM 12988]|nr:hypothetical protein HMPREF1532_02594 [Bacteroides salyersiae WAL 10018 = DSM 18765 = JCM 12988]
METNIIMQYIDELLQDNSNEEAGIQEALKLI